MSVPAYQNTNSFSISVPNAEGVGITIPAHKYVAGPDFVNYVGQIPGFVLAYADSASVSPQSDIVYSNADVTGPYAGQSGYSGKSGYSGSGVSGYSGSGISGYSGLGLSGYSGISGYSGATGASGYSGVTGVNSVDGLSGIVAVSGVGCTVSVSGQVLWLAVP